MKVDVKEVMEISADFEGGNIEHVETLSLQDDVTVVVRLKIRPDVYTELEEIHHMQYFCFRASVKGNTTSNVKVRYAIINASDASFPFAWDGTTVCYTVTADYQNVDQHWRRNRTTRYMRNQLVWEHVHTKDTPSVYFSFFPPYTYQRHCSFMEECKSVASANVSILGKSLDGHDLHYITVGHGPLQAWIIHRQHPGETMAEHYAEGLLRCALHMNENDDKDNIAVVDKVLDHYTLHIVPCMCPDGAVRGHL